MDQRETSWRLRGGLRRGPSARRFGPSRRPRVAMEVNPAPLLSCTSSPPNPPATTLRLPLHKFETGTSRRTFTETAQVANEPHAQPWQRGRTAGAATSPGFFPARRATCQQTALKKVGSKREAGQRPPRVTQPPVVQEGVHVDGDREIRAALEQHCGLPQLWLTSSPPLNTSLRRIARIAGEGSLTGLCNSVSGSPRKDCHGFGLAASNDFDNSDSLPGSSLEQPS